jgi:hypothetical protein
MREAQMREAEMVCSGASAIPPDGDRAVGPTAPAVGNVAPVTALYRAMLAERRARW